MNGIAVALLYSCLGLLVACDKGSDRREPLLRHNRADLLVVFKPGTTEREVNQYLEQKVVVGSIAKGFWPRNGIEGGMLFRRDGYTGYSLVVAQGLSSSARSELRVSLSESPVVKGVYADVDPKTFVPPRQAE